MKRPLLIFVFACFVALSSILCGSLCGQVSGEPAANSTEIDG